MKNVIILLLTAGLAVSVYFNLKKDSAEKKGVTLNGSTGTDSVNISFKLLGDNTGKIFTSSPGTYSTGPDRGKVVICCPKPPIDTNIDHHRQVLEMIKEIEIHSVPSKKP